MYVGPIPLRVDPILFLPFDFSLAAARSLWVGRI